MAKKITGEMPHSLEAEQALLGCLLLDTRIQVEVASYISDTDFFAESHQTIFNAMQDIIRANKPVDLVTLTDLLEKQGSLEQAGGIAYITELTNVIPSAANFQMYLDIIKRDSMLRSLIKGAADVVSFSKTSTDAKSALAYAEKTVYDISNTADTSEIVKIGAVIPEVITKFDELSKEKSSYRGMKTQFRALDNMLNGLHGSDLIILAARPAMGKTSLAMNIVENVALQGYSCAVFSLEMGKEQLVQRMICSVAGVSMENALKGRLNKVEWLKIAKARDMLSNAKIYIDDSSMIRPSEMLSKCRRLKRKNNGLDFVMIDYVQLMTPDKSRGADSRQNEISDISRNLKILAKELNVPVIALSQLSRSSEKEKRQPQLSDLRESGAIEQDADIVLFIHRPDKFADDNALESGKVKKDVAEIIIAKHRNGDTGKVKLFFRKECTKFVNLNYETNEPEDVEDMKENAPRETPYIDGLGETDVHQSPEYFGQSEEAPPFDDFEVDNGSPDDEIF